MKKTYLLLLSLLVAPCWQAQAATQEYIRDYTYPASRYDSEYTSRIRAIDGVKQTLLDELGVYVASVININKDNLGNETMSHDITTITAGVLSMKVLQENWNRIEYYLKARMQADPDEVLKSIKELKQNQELEQALRESAAELKKARDEVAALKNELEATRNQNQAHKTEAELVVAYQLAVGDLEQENGFQAAMRAYMLGDYQSMLQQMMALAGQGYPKAQARLAWLYERGVGVTTDYAKAMSLYQQAMEKDDGFAYARLGFMYQRGLGVEKDNLKAVEYLEKSIAKGNGHGHALMGYTYFVGAGVAKDYDESYKHAVLAKDKGNSWGYAWLGRVYEFGLGVEVDYKEAFKWDSKAAELSDPLGLALLGHLYLKGRGVEKDEEKALKYITAGADRKNPLAQAMLGILYEHGIGMEDEDEKKAFELYKESARQGNTLGMMRYARSYWEGIGVEEDRVQGKKLVLEVVKKGMPRALKVHMLMTRNKSWTWAEFFFDEKWNPSN